MENRTVYCSTRMFEGDDPTKTKLTLDFQHVTEAELVEYAIDALVIKWQNSIRRKKDSKVPAEATYIVPKPGTRAAQTLTPYQMLEALFGKEKCLDLVNKAGGDVDAVISMFKTIIE